MTHGGNRKDNPRAAKQREESSSLLSTTTQEENSLARNTTPMFVSLCTLFKGKKQGETEQEALTVL